MKFGHTLRFILAMMFAGLALAPAAQAGVQAGILTCRSAGGVSFILGSVREFACVFRPSLGKPQRYQAVVRRVGVDVGFSQDVRLAWAVIAPTRRVGPGDLAGSYGGVSAGAAVGVGLGANALVGGLNNSFALQPLSVETQQGLNVAAGIAGLELRYRR